ncbi:MAG: hypothetical protein ABIA47_05080 [bacterium]
MSKNVLTTLAVIVTLLAAWLLLELAGVFEAGVLSEIGFPSADDEEISSETEVEMSVEVISGNVEATVEIAEG